MSAWDNPAEMSSRAENARAQGDVELAYQLYARASEINPQDAGAWQGRADTAHNVDEALVSYGYAAALLPENESLARTLDASITQRLASAPKSDAPLLIAVGQELAEVGLTAQAQQFFRRATELDHNADDALVWLAGLSDDPDQQLDYLNRALETNPRDPRARAGLLALKSPAPPPAPAPLLEPKIEEPDGPVTSRLKRASHTETQAQVDSSMERLRRLRETSNPVETKPQPAPAATKAPQSPARADHTMRYVFLALLALVVILAFAGIFLLLNQ